MPNPKNNSPRTSRKSAPSAFSCLVSLLFCSASYAEAVTPTQQIQTRANVEASSTNANLSAKAAEAWGLNSQEWTKYQDLMQGPRGIYSPGLDPLTALGIEASSPEERRRYAELQVNAERQRVEKELAYQRAYDKAFARLYPDEKIIQLSSAPQSSPVTTASTLKSSARLAVFVRENCPPCIAQVKTLQSRKQAFDLYFVGSQNDDERIRRWAILAGIDPANVRSRTITLNHDNDRWAGLGITGDLPALVREVNGRWQRQ